MNALQVHVLDLDPVWIRDARVDVLVEAEGELVDVEFPRLGHSDAVVVNFIRQVLKPHQYLVLVNWQQHVRLVLLEVHRFLKLRRIRHLRPDMLLGVKFEIEVEEVDWRLLLPQLLRSLLRFRLLGIEYLQVIPGVALDAETVELCLVERLVWRHVITVEHSSILHQLNIGPLCEVGRATLRPLVHDIHLNCRLTALVTHRDGRINWIEVGRDRLVVRQSRFVERSISNLHFLNVSLDHTEGIGVCPEPALWIKSVIELPVDSNVLALEIVDVDGVEEHFELNDFIPELRRESNVDDALLILIGVLIGEYPLFDEVTALICDFLVKLTEILWLSVGPLRHENVVTFTPFDIEYFRYIGLRPGTVWIQNLLLVAKVLLQVDAEALVQSLLTVLIIEKDLTHLSEARYRQLWPVVLLVVSITLRRPHLIHFVDLEDPHRVTRNASLNVNSVVNVLRSILVPCLLLDDVALDVNELLALPRPRLGGVVRCRQQHFNESIESANRWIVHDDEERAGVLMMVDRTLHHCLVLRERVASDKLVFQQDIALRFDEVVDIFLVCRLALFEGSREPQRIVLCHVLEGCSRDGIMVRQHCQDVLHVVRLLLYFSNLLARGFLVYEPASVELLLRMEQTRVIFHLLFEPWPRRKESRPVRTVLLGIRKEIMILNDRPRHVFILERLDIP